MPSNQNDIQLLQTETISMGASSVVTGVTGGPAVSWLYIKQNAVGGTVLLIGTSIATGSSITTGYPCLNPSDGWLKFQGPTKFWLHNSSAASVVHIIRGLNTSQTLTL